MHLSPYATVHPVERGDISARTDRGVLEEDANHHCMNVAVGRKVGQLSQTVEGTLKSMQQTQRTIVLAANEPTTENLVEEFQQAVIQYGGTSPSEFFVH